MLGTHVVNVYLHFMAMYGHACCRAATRQPIPLYLHDHFDWMRSELYFRSLVLTPITHFILVMIIAKSGSQGSPLAFNMYIVSNAQPPHSEKLPL